MPCTERHIENGTPVDRPCGGDPVAAPPPSQGPGTELRAILRDWFGVVSSESCSCNSTAKRMNAMGADWCEGAGLPVILSAMRGEHEKRRKSGKTILPWTDMGATMLVRLACRMARRKQGCRIS